MNFDEESYRLIVRDLLDTNVNDSSDRDLSILRPEIDILSFADEETDYIMPSTTNEISWTSKGVSNVDIELYGVKNGEESTTKVMAIAESVVDTGNYTWKVPENFDELHNNEFKDGCYRIKINDSSNDSFFGVSERDLLITLPEIRITSTNTTLKAGDTCTVEFEYTGKNFNSKIDLYKNDSYYSTLSDDSFFDNSSKHEYSWTVPSTIDVGDSFSLRFGNTDGDIAYRNKYTALSIVPVINVTSLNTDDMVWKPNNTYNITWNKTGSFSHVDIFLVSDTGYTTAVAEKVSNSGSYSWKVPSDITISNSKLMVKVAEEKNYFNYVNPNSIPGYSDKKLSIYSLCNGLDEVIDNFGVEMLDTGREALKDIAKIHLSETEKGEDSDSDEDLNPKPDSDTNMLKTASIDEDLGDWIEEIINNYDDREFVREKLNRLRENGWKGRNEEEGGPTEYYNEETDETIIVNEDSDYDMKIVYSVDENEPTLQMLMQENPRGGADIYVYYNVWLRSKEDPDHLIHEEKMRMKYEYIIEVDGGDGGPRIVTGGWQRTSVEVSFNYDEEYEAGEKDSDDKVIWEYYEIRNNDAKTLWMFYFKKIFGGFNPIEDLALETWEKIDNVNKDENNAYFIYTNTYDERIYTKIYNPHSRKIWNQENPHNSVSEESKLITLMYYQYNTKILEAECNLLEYNNNNIELLLKNNDGEIVGEIPVDISNLMTNQITDDEFFDFISNNNFNACNILMTSIFHAVQQAHGRQYDWINVGLEAFPNSICEIFVVEIENSSGQKAFDYKLRITNKNGETIEVCRSNLWNPDGEYGEVSPDEYVVTIRDENGYIKREFKFDPDKGYYQERREDGTWGAKKPISDFDMKEYLDTINDKELIEAINNYMDAMAELWEKIEKILRENALSNEEIKKLLEKANGDIEKLLEELEEMGRTDIAEHIGNILTKADDNLRDIAKNLVANFISGIFGD